jgi:excisionase family DNA binding protein
MKSWFRAGDWCKGSNQQPNLHISVRSSVLPPAWWWGILRDITAQIGHSNKAEFIGGVVMNRLPDAEVLLTPREVADLFGVDPKTVTRWAKAGKLTSIRTLGGHRRYRKSEVDDLRQNYFKAQN